MLCNAPGEFAQVGPEKTGLRFWGSGHLFSESVLLVFLQSVQVVETIRGKMPHKSLLNLT